MPEFQFETYGILTRTPLGNIEPQAFKFNMPIWAAGQCEMKISIDRNATALKRRTEPDKVQLIVRGSNGSIVWDGPILMRNHQPGQPFISVKAAQWKSWLYDRLYMTKVFQENYDQKRMAYDIIDYAKSVPGTPSISYDRVLDGVMRQFTISRQWSAGKALDSFGSRDGGYEWELRSRDGNDGLPQLWFRTWNIGQEHSSRPTLSLSNESTRNNMSVGAIPEDATERRTKVWALGDGQEPDQLAIADTSPLLGLPDILLRETATVHTGATEAATLFDHARAERLIRDLGTSTLPVDHSLDNPTIYSYEPGDRARLTVKSQWEDFDIRGIRVIDRMITKQPASATIVTDVLDLTDIRDLAV